MKNSKFLKKSENPMTKLYRELRDLLEDFGLSKMFRFDVITKSMLYSGERFEKVSAIDLVSIKHGLTMKSMSVEDFPMSEIPQTIRIRLSSFVNVRGFAIMDEILSHLPEPFADATFNLNRMKVQLSDNRFLHVHVSSPRQETVLLKCSRLLKSAANKVSIDLKNGAKLTATRSEGFDIRPKIDLMLETAEVECNSSNLESIFGAAEYSIKEIDRLSNSYNLDTKSIDDAISHEMKSLDVRTLYPKTMVRSDYN